MALWVGIKSFDLFSYYPQREGRGRSYKSACHGWLDRNGLLFLRVASIGTSNIWFMCSCSACLKPLRSFLCSGDNALWVDTSQFPTPFKEEAPRHSVMGFLCSFFKWTRLWSREEFTLEDMADRIGRNVAARYFVSLSLKSKAFPGVFDVALY